MKPQKVNFWLFFLVLGCLGATLLRCGESDKKDKKDPLKPEVPAEIPTDWDGTADWSGSAFKVVDE